MATLYENPKTMHFNNSLLKHVKINSYMIYNPREMLFIDENGHEIKYIDLDEKNKKIANKVFDLQRHGFLKFAN